MFRHFKDRLFSNLQHSIDSWRLALCHPPGAERSATLYAERESIPSLAASTREQEEQCALRAGLPGKNVEWVPCSPVVLDKMLELARIMPEDYLLDPGSGDGRIVIRAAKLGTRALGIEANSKLVELSRQNAVREGVSDKASFLIGDFFELDFSAATVVTLFLRWDINLALRKKLLALKPGTRIVSNIFGMADWDADETVKVEDEDYYFRNHTVYLWVVPASVEGTWKLPHGELKLTQKFQLFEGALAFPDKTLPVTGKITGEQITMTIDGREFLGNVSGNRMDMAARPGSDRWNAFQVV
jgi:SAM-dependent methyltransferase